MEVLLFPVHSLPPAGLQETGYYEHLYSLIEETYLINNRAPVTLLAHSMGGPVSLFFLSKVAPADWKASRIKQYITLSGVFAGCVDPLKAIISGDNEGIVTASPLVIRELQRSCGSEVFLLPFPSSLWTKDDVLVVQPERNYSIYDLEALFTDLNYTNGWAMWEGVQNLVSDFPAPNVTSFCFYGTNSSTVEQLIYNTGQFPDKQPSFKYGNGDGTVNLRSLQACSQWTSRQTPQVTMRGFSGVVHTNMVEDINVLKAVQELVLS